MLGRFEISYLDDELELRRVESWTQEENASERFESLNKSGQRGLRLIDTYETPKNRIIAIGNA